MLHVTVADCPALIVVGDTETFTVGISGGPLFAALPYPFPPQAVNTVITEAAANLSTGPLDRPRPRE